MTSDLSEDDLRLLYLDWCSTRVARRFLELSLDEVWLRSRSAASLPSASTPPPPDTASLAALDRIPDYLDLVRKTALVLAEEMDLPGFVQWEEEYRRNPEAFDHDILNR